MRSLQNGLLMSTNTVMTSPESTTKYSILHESKQYCPCRTVVDDNVDLFQRSEQLRKHSYSMYVNLYRVRIIFKSAYSKTVCRNASFAKIERFRLYLTCLCGSKVCRVKTVSSKIQKILQNICF